MWEQIDRRLTLAAEKTRPKQKLQAMLREAQTMLRDSQTRQTMHQNRLTKEQADVEALEGMTLTAMFYWLIGAKEDRLDQERQELVAAKLKYDEACKAVRENEQSCREGPDTINVAG